MSVLWDETLRDVAKVIAPQEMREFIGQLRVVEQQSGRLLLEVPNRRSAEIIRERYLSLLQESVSRISSGSICDVTLHVTRPKQQELFPEPEKDSILEEASRTSSAPTLLPKYTFRNFIVGASNQFAHAASQAVANQPGERYNPLFIYGGSGLGKTHLANAIGHQVLKRNPAARVIYLSSDSFMNELIAAIRSDRMHTFKERFRHVHVLIVDDVQFLAGRERTQEEFFHTFNSLYDNHRQIVLTSDKFPKEIPDLEERLRNRFEWGLIADIQPPDMETRVAILGKKAEIEAIKLPHEVAIFLASNIDSNVRELEGSLTRLGAFASLNKCPITVDLAQEVLKSVLKVSTNQVLTIEAIQKLVCDFFNIRARDLCSKKRSRSIAVPRQVAIYLCRRHTQASFPVIGERFGGRDHSTAIHAIQVIERRMRDEPEFRDTIAQLERALQHQR